MSILGFDMWEKIYDMKVKEEKLDKAEKQTHKNRKFLFKELNQICDDFNSDFEDCKFVKVDDVWVQDPDGDCYYGDDDKYIEIFRNQFKFYNNIMKEKDYDVNYYYKYDIVDYLQSMFDEPNGYDYDRELKNILH